MQRLLLIFFSCALICGCAKTKKEGLINVLILSGKNNHEWQKTTPLLVKIYKDSRLFTINVTEKPDTLSYCDLRKYDVIVSNWNTWPDNNLRLTKEWENDFLRYVKEGGGVVSFHAGASSFYSWNEYHQIGTGRWGKETHHGKPAKGKVYGFDQTHPITKGIRDFYIIDELWEKTDICPDARALASLTGNDETDGHVISEEAVFINQTGKGRSFYTILGHDERALLNSGLQTLILKGTLWAAKCNVTTDIHSGLKRTNASSNTSLTWNESDTTVCLKRGTEVIWQYNFNNRFGKQYFHPVTAGNSTLTCVSPPDHPWHMGLWFSWKYLNGINYWEYLDNFKSDETGYRSAGKTTIQEIEIAKNTDFSANIRMDIVYQPIDGKPVMSEKNVLYISAPLTDGSYFIDYNSTFIPLTDELVLDRTPIEGEPLGQSWGGYAGLSIRFNQDYTIPEIIAQTESDKYKKSTWVYMGFTTLTGERAGMCILQNMKYTTPNTSWYVINNPEIPFYYYSPAVLFDSKIVLKKGETLNLKYRVWILPGKIRKEELQKKYDEYMNEIS